MKKFGFSFAIILFLCLSGKAQTKIPADIEKLLSKNTCLACHKVDTRLVGPAYIEVMKQKKYKPAQIVELMYKPNPANWAGYPPMAAMTNVPKDEALKIAKWIVTLK